jgi:hypothetical protein
MREIITTATMRHAAQNPRPTIWLVQFGGQFWENVGEGLLGQFFCILSLGLYTNMARLRYWLTLMSGVQIHQHKLTTRPISGYLSGLQSLISLALLVVVAMAAFIAVQNEGALRYIAIVCALVLLLVGQMLQNLTQQRERLNLIGWQGHGLTTLSPLPHSTVIIAVLLQVSNWMCLGAIAPVLRLWIWRNVTADLVWGKERITSLPNIGPILLPYLAGWALAWAGLIGIVWYFWHEVGQYLWLWYQTGFVDMAWPVAQSNLTELIQLPAGAGSPPPDVMAQLAIVLNGLSMVFIMIPLYGFWRIFVFSPYEAIFWRETARQTTVADSPFTCTLGFIDICLLNWLSWGLNFLTAGLTRPAMLHLRFKTICAHLHLSPSPKLLQLTAAAP